MKRKSYQESSQVSINKVLMYLNSLQVCMHNSHLEEVINEACDIKDIQKLISNRPMLQEDLFRKLKAFADQSDNYEELENYIIIMNCLFDRQYEPYQRYKHKLVLGVYQHLDEFFTCDEYCLIRHLVDFKEGSIEKIIEIGWKSLPPYPYAYHYFTSEIYLIEKQYEKAIDHLQYIDAPDLIQEYGDGLQSYIRTKYMFNFKMKKYYTRLCFNQ